VPISHWNTLLAQGEGALPGWMLAHTREGGWSVFGGRGLGSQIGSKGPLQQADA